MGRGEVAGAFRRRATRVVVAGMPAGGSGVVRVVVIAAVLFGTGMLTTVVVDGRRGVFRGDADLFRLVAADPFGDGSAVSAEDFGSAYRYGRIFYPLLAWLLGAGRPGASEVALLLLAVAGCVATVGLAAALLARGGVAPERALWLLTIPGVWLAGMASFSEPVVLALLLAALVTELGDRRVLGSACFAGLLMTREAAAVAAVPAVIRDLRARGLSALPRWLAVVAPLGVWWGWVRWRVGDWPFLDESQARRDALALPFTGLLEASREARFGAAGWAIAVAGMVTVVLAIVVWQRSSWPLVPATGLAAALLIPFLGPSVWRWPGDAARILTIAQVLVLLAWTEHLSGRALDRSARGR